MAQKVRVGINGYGVIGKRLADAAILQDDMELLGVADVVYNYRLWDVPHTPACAPKTT